MDKSLIAALLLLPGVALAQTHTMPGSNVVPSGASLTIQSGGTINAAAGSTVTGFGTGGGSVSLTATAPIVVTPSPITGTGVISLTATTVGQSFLSLTNPSAITFPEISATNVVSTKTAAQLKTDLSLTSTDVGLANVTNNAQTQASIVPNTAPSAGQILIGNVGGTAYAKQTLTGATLSAAGALSGITGGSTNQLQYNNAGVFGGVPTLTYDGTNTVLDLSAAAGTKIRIKANGAGPDGFIQDTAGVLLMSQNGYYNGTNWQYDVTGPLSIASLTGGGFTVYTAPSGSAGATAPLTAGFVSYNSTGAGVNAADPGANNFTVAGIVNAVGGYKVNSAAASGKILQGNGTIFTNSTPTWPTASGSSGVIVQSNGTNLITSTATWPTAATTGKVIFGNGTNYVESTPTYPNAASPTLNKHLKGDGTNWVASTSTFAEGAVTAGKILQSDATNWIASTPTWPTTAGAAGYQVRSDATNFSSYPTQLSNASTTNLTTSTADIYLAGSSIVLTAGDMKAKGQYHCVFDMAKTAGTGAIIVSVRVGTLGTTGDAAILQYTFGAGTAVADSGVFEVWATFRTVGSGTSAVMVGSCQVNHQLSTTGLISNAATWPIIGVVSSGFNSSTATVIGCSFNGQTAFAGTNTMVQSTLEQ